MKQIPIVRVTELLAQAYGIFAMSVTQTPSEFALHEAAFHVDDGQGTRWRLRAQPAICATHALSRDAAGNDTRSLNPPRARPTLSGQAVVVRWNLHWTLFPWGKRVAAQAGTLSTGVADCRHCRIRTQGLGCALSAAQDPVEELGIRAMDRVGSWLYQPAGLTTATDIPGQGFTDLLRRHRLWLAMVHARAERLHASRRSDSGNFAQAGGGGGTSPARASAEDTLQSDFALMQRLVQLHDVLLPSHGMPRHSQASRVQALRDLERLYAIRRAASTTGLSELRQG